MVFVYVNISVKMRSEVLIFMWFIIETKHVLGKWIQKHIHNSEWICMSAFCDWAFCFFDAQ